MLIERLSESETMRTGGHIAANCGWALCRPTIHHHSHTVDLHKSDSVWATYGALVTQSHYPPVQHPWPPGRQAMIPIVCLMKLFNYTISFYTGRTIHNTAMHASHHISVVFVVKNKYYSFPKFNIYNCNIVGRELSSVIAILMHRCFWYEIHC